MKPHEPHVLCRPPRGAIGIANVAVKPLQLIGKRWLTKDNGKPALAYIGALRSAPFDAIVWVASCNCDGASCPRWKALEYAREELGLEAITVHERPRAKRSGSVKVR